MMTTDRLRPRSSAAEEPSGADDRPVIEFLCRAGDEEVIAKPVPAASELPGWFRRLPGVDEHALSARDNGLTIKRCMPFLDALSTGWVIPVAATTRLEIRDDGATVDAGWEFDREMVSTHSAWQARGNPFEPRPPMKFHNYWSIRTPPGWSCLFVPPLNRPNPVIEVLSGVVDTDTYIAPVNFPFFAIAPDGVYTLDRGTPLVQVVPFHRDALALGSFIGPETEADEAARGRVHRNTLATEGWYRQAARAPRGVGDRGRQMTGPG